MLEQKTEAQKTEPNNEKGEKNRKTRRISMYAFVEYVQYGLTKLEKRKNEMIYAGGLDVEQGRSELLS